MALTGLEKVAAFLLSLDTDTASAVLSRFGAEEIEELSRSMLQMRSIPKEEVDHVHSEYMQMATTAGFIPDARPLAEQLIRMAVGDEKSSEMLGQAGAPRHKPFEVLAAVDARQLADLLRDEHPQTVALVLSYLKPQQAGLVLSRLPEEVHSDVVTRMTALELTPADVVDRVEQIIASKVQAPDAQVGVVSEESKNKMVAEVLNVVGKSVRKKVLEEMARESPEQAKQIEDLMFVFDDFAGVDDHSIRKLVMEVDNDTLALALKTASEELRNKFLKNLSKRAAAMVLETLESLGPKPLSEVETAQHEIMREAHALDEQGEIALRRGEQEQLV